MIFLAGGVGARCGRSVLLVLGRFDAGSGSGGNYGDAGMGMVQNYYHTGRPELLERALTLCDFWADLAVNHCDFSIYQMLSGGPWKTCAYSKFGDILYGYLETGDPYLLDAAEMCADAYWRWFRANWPRCEIGRDTYPVAGLARMWRMLDSRQARDRAVEITRMVGAVLQSRGTIGGQMGGGPHPGYLSSLYMTGVCMIALLEVAEAQAETCEQPLVEGLPDMLLRLHQHYMRRDVEILPCFLKMPGGADSVRRTGHWAAMASRIYPEMGRLQGVQQQAVRAGLARCHIDPRQPDNDWSSRVRSGPRLIPPLYHDAFMLGARWTGDGVTLEPLGDPRSWPERQVVYTPAGELVVTAQPEPGAVCLSFSAPTPFPVRVAIGDWQGESSSTCQTGLRVPL